MVAMRQIAVERNRFMDSSSAWSDRNGSSAVTDAFHFNSEFLHHCQQDVGVRGARFAHDVQITFQLSVGMPH
jgi:hypothetical protein